ncbi:hypothetical protein SAMN05443634_104107 [Chishuiella changwenlii]|uniref:DUF6046 domain-containing protein n=1 Tax=Chishuiella changwenlii TaxID=1434701 RepID=A0A1M6W0G2_9FLAO|nr:DUF6046 domain-containing protein [Chishuiella changwenlii]GGE89431.1 hypothetical protein GCM10010984_03840 [Chishuiella changwenlii]SHK87086.1 hypothetical protein SAMN05443634_104107 [Chishuiella changwenlii]
MDNQYTKVFNDSFKFPENVTIDLAARYASAFGVGLVNKLVKKIHDKKDLKENLYKDKIQTYTNKNNDFETSIFEFVNNAKIDTSYDSKSSIKEVFDEFKFVFSPMLYVGNKDGIKEFEDKEKNIKKNIKHIYSPPLIMDFSQEKSLVETEVNDDNPIIVERWGTKPWSISIKGLLIDMEEHNYPEDKINSLNKLWKNNTIIKVTGAQFLDKDIASIYFKSIDFSPLVGFQDTIQFSINATSIKPVSFTLDKPDMNSSSSNGNMNT